MRVVMSVAIGLTLLLPTGQALTQSALEANPPDGQICSRSDDEGLGSRPAERGGRSARRVDGRAVALEDGPRDGGVAVRGDKVGHEWLRYTTEFADAVFHVEFRFTKLDGEPAYNAGVFIRSSADGAIWHQAQATPAGGFLFGSTLVNGTASASTRGTS